MTKITAKVEETAIDFFTITAKGQSELEMLAMANDIIQDELSGIKAKPWKFYGYEGWWFKDVNGHFAVASSNHKIQGSICQSSGRLSHGLFWQLAPKATNCSRVDLQVTTEMIESDPEYIQKQWEYVRRIDAAKQGYSIIINNREGTTLYVGSRVSRKFGRVYDKGVEDDQNIGPGNKIRWELELKQDAAKKAMDEFINLPLGPTLAQQINATVYDYFNSKEVFPNFRRGDVRGLDLTLKAKTKTDDQRLLWLQRQVAPAVREMLSNGDIGVLDALGVTDYFELK